MGKPTGFLEYDRVDGPVVSEEKRIENFSEFHGMLDEESRRKQAARCMDCGVPFCQAGMMISGMASGCPLHNLVPELNDLVYRGCFEQAFRRLNNTHSFPEFTSRVCPALCEAACTAGLHGASVSTKENEKSVIEYAYLHGLVEEEVPEIRTGKKVAVVGSGPAGLAAAQLLNRRGHLVTVYERNDRIGGLLRYGIPNMKLDKSVIDRRIKLMEEAGVTFITGVNVCGSKKKGNDAPGLILDKVKNISADELKKEYDAVILACGASNPRDIKAPGREAEGIYFAVDFLGRVTKELLDTNFEMLHDLEAVKKAEGAPKGDSNRTSKENSRTISNSMIDKVYGKDVIVIGGGDTGNDCVGTSIRLGCKSVTQLEMMPKAPDVRLASNPWPEWPRVCKTDYGQEEAIYKFGHDPRIYQTTVKEFVYETVPKFKASDKEQQASDKEQQASGKNQQSLDKDQQALGKDQQAAGTVKRLKAVIIQSLEPKKDEKTGRMMMVPVEGSEKTLPAQLVLIAAGFLGSESYVTEGFGVEVDGRTNVKTRIGHYEAVVSEQLMEQSSAQSDKEQSSAQSDKAQSSAQSGKACQGDAGHRAKIYTAGDMHRGQSLVVWAISEGRNAAREVDAALMGFTNL